MSYDYPDDYVPPPAPPWTLRRWLADKWWRFCLWCALDAKSDMVNRWGFRRIHGGKGPVPDPRMSDKEANSLMKAIQNHAELARMAEESPLELLAMIESGCLAPEDLTFAAECAGDIQDRAAAIPVLMGLLGHASPLVREGVIYGLTVDVDKDLRVRTAICEAADRDESPGVRSAAVEALNSD